MREEIRLLTKRDRILKVADRWSANYRNRSWTGSNKQKIWLALKTLDLSTATEDDIEAIIGNRSWTNIRCNQCEKLVERAVLIGGSDEYGPDNICEQCVREAVRVLEATE